MTRLRGSFTVEGGDCEEERRVNGDVSAPLLSPLPPPAAAVLGGERVDPKRPVLPSLVVPVLPVLVLVLGCDEAAAAWESFAA